MASSPVPPLAGLTSFSSLLQRIRFQGKTAAQVIFHSPVKQVAISAGSGGNIAGGADETFHSYFQRQRDIAFADAVAIKGRG